MCKCYDGNFTDFIHESLSYLQNCPDSLKHISRSQPEQREPDRMSGYRERKPRSKGLLARVKCQQRNARTSAILSVFPKPRESVSAMLLVPLLLSPFPIFLTFLKAAKRKPSSSSAITLPSEVNTERSRLHTNWHFKRTLYHWSLILRSFRAKLKLIEDDANGFVKALCQFPHLWILNPLF